MLCVGYALFLTGHSNQTTVAYVVYDPPPVSACAVMRVPAPYVPMQCLLLPLFHHVRTQAMMLLRRIALCGLLCPGCAICVLARAGVMCLCRGFAYVQITLAPYYSRAQTQNMYICIRKAGLAQTSPSS